MSRNYLHVFKYNSRFFFKYTKYMDSRGFLFEIQLFLLITIVLL